MNTNMKILLTTAGLSELFSGFSASYMKAEALEEKTNEEDYKKNMDLLKDSLIELRNSAEIRSIDTIEDEISDLLSKESESQENDIVKLVKEAEIILEYNKLQNALNYLPTKYVWNITNDFMMIVGKYFESSKDYVNVMKVNKKYEQLVSMYKFNPISDPSLFEHIQTQHFYNKEDVQNKKDGMYKYIYWPWYDYNDIKNQKDNEIFKNIELNLDNYNRNNSLLDTNFPLALKDGNWIIPEGITRIGYRLLTSNFRDRLLPDYFRDRVTNINLPSTLKEIGEDAFKNTKITSIIIPEGVTSIGNSCFARCYKLTNITFPSTLKEIGEKAFTNTKITSIIIPEGVTSIVNSCFYSCLQLTNITLPSTLKEIGDEAFKNTKITSIIIPEGVSKIGKWCFLKNFKLTNITLPSTLKEIGEGAFSNSKITSIIIPDGVSKIGTWCFENCLQLTNITLPSTLKEIGYAAFNSGKIASIIIPEGVSKIGAWCFENCLQLTNITLPSTLKEIGNGAFNNTKITSIIIPKGVTYYGKELQNGNVINGHINVQIKWGYDNSQDEKNSEPNDDGKNSGKNDSEDKNGSLADDPEFMEVLRNIEPNTTAVPEGITQINRPEETTRTIFADK